MIPKIGEQAERCLAYIQCQLRQPRSRGATQRPKAAITISRQTGSGALEVAQRLAAILETSFPTPEGQACPWVVFDRNLIEIVLEDHQLPRTLSQYFPEDRLSYLHSLVRELLGLHPPTWTLYEHMVETILKLADLGNVILIGRGANVITARLPHVFHVRLIGSLENRIRRICEQTGMPPSEARKFIEKEDRGRARFVKERFGVNIDDPSLYHLVLNTDRFDLPHIATLIAECVLNYWGIQLPKPLTPSSEESSPSNRKPSSSPLPMLF